MENYKLYIKDIYVKKNSIYIVHDQEINCINLKSKNVSINNNIYNNIIDIKKIINENNILFIGKKKYRLCAIDREGIQREISIFNSISNGKSYIAKGIKIDCDESCYYIDLYIDLDDSINIIINKVMKNDFIGVNFESIQLQNTELEVGIKVFEKIKEDSQNEETYEKHFYKLSKVELVLIGKNSDEVYKYKGKGEGEEFKFNINLLDLLKDIDYNLTAFIVINGEPYELKIQKKLLFKSIRLENDKNIKYLTIVIDKMKRLRFNIGLDIRIKPIIENVTYGKGLIINGKINANLNVFNESCIECLAKLTSADGKYIEIFKADVNNNDFFIKIPEDCILDMKNSFSGKWDITLEIVKCEEVLSKANIISEKKKNSKSKKIVYKESLNIDGENIEVHVVKPKVSNNVEIQVKNEVNIDKINYIVVRKNKLIIRFKAKSNIEELVKKKKLIANIYVNDIILMQSSIKLIGKKSFIVEYLSKNPAEISEQIYKQGVQVKCICGDRYGISNVSDVDKDTIFDTLWKRVQHSKKYKKIVRGIYRKFLVKLPIKNNYIVYESFLGRNMSDSPKYIYEYLNSKYENKFKHIWVFNQKRDDLPKDIKQVKRFSFEHLYYIAISKFWINNMRQPTWFIRRDNQLFLATWHGTPLKKLVFDIEEIHSANKNYKQEFYEQSRVWDYLISANKYSTEIFRRAFKFDNEILELGYPRNDLLYSDNKEEIAINIKKALGIPIDKKIVLYAPTWRDDEVLKPGKYKFKLELDLQRLRKELGDEYFFIIRTHYFIANHIDITGMEDFVYNASKYDDITELYLLSDVLITDYSSVFFDYANLKRPTLFFTYDLEKYRDVLRGFYLDLEKEGPGPIVMTNDEIINELRDFNKLSSRYKNRIEEFHKRFCSWDDGKAAARIAEEVIVKNSK